MSRPRKALLLLGLSSCQLIAANPSESSPLKDIPYGLEFLTQYKSEYNYRGFILAQDTIDIQFGGNYAFDDTTSLNAASWFATEAGSGDFTEAGLLVDLQKEIDQWTLSLSGTYHSFTNTFLESGTNIEAAAYYQWNGPIESSGRIAYDTGAEGWFSALSSSYYQRINDQSYLLVDFGISYVSHYYGREGFNDAYGKISYTYNINQSLSISPYIGTSLLLDNKDTGRDSLYGGIYLAVSF